MTVVAILLVLAGFGVLSAARSAIQEILGVTMLLVAAVFFSGSAIASGIRQLRVELWRYHGGVEQPVSPAPIGSARRAAWEEAQRETHEEQRG